MASAPNIEEVQFTMPEPEPLRPEMAKQQPFPVGDLGPILGGAVEAVASQVRAPHSLAAQSVLAACSLAVQPHFNVRLPTGQIRPTSLFLVSVAESGDRKSTSDDLAMDAIREYERELADEYGTLRSSAAMEQSAWDESKKAITQRVKNQGVDALKEAYRDLGPRPEGPIEPTIIIRTGTTQGLLKRFITARPSLGLMSSEGGSWLGGYGMSEDNRLATISTLSDFWDGADIQTLTAGEGLQMLRNRRLTFHLMVQPGVADRLLGDAEALDQGFLSRLLVSHPESLAGTRIVDPDALPSEIDLAALGVFRDRLARIIRSELPVMAGTMILEPRELRMTDQARRMWWAFSNALERQVGPDGELRSVKGFVGKLPEMAARLAANIEVFGRGVKTAEIGTEALARGIALAQFYLAEAQRLFGQQRTPAIYEDAQQLSDWLRDKWTENLVSVSAISAGGPGKLRNKSDYIRDIGALLVRHSHLVDVPNGGMVKGKRVRMAWRVVVGRG